MYYSYIKSKYPRPEFELVSLSIFPTMITISLQEPLWMYIFLKIYYNNDCIDGNLMRKIFPINFT